jgi:SAM-dependent methyltransferase
MWARKHGLRAVYERWFRRLREACAPDAPVVEIGCGPGFFKERYPEIVATDVTENPHADRVVDAAALPFGDGEVGSFVLLDVFHHLLKPEAFLRESARTLRPGGRLVLLEPWMGLAGRALYRYVHHEHCDLGVDPLAPWQGPQKDPMLGNSALPYLYFRPDGVLEHLDLPLRTIHREPLAAVDWVLSGGFQPVNLLPRALVGMATTADRLLSRIPALTATRCFLIIEKTAPA